MQGLKCLIHDTKACIVLQIGPNVYYNLNTGLAEVL